MKLNFYVEKQTMQDGHDVYYGRCRQYPFLAYGPKNSRDAALSGIRRLGKRVTVAQGLTMLPRKKVEEGAVIGYKKVFAYANDFTATRRAYIARLYIGPGVRRVVPLSYDKSISGDLGKCRAASAKVLSITTIAGNHVKNKRKKFFSGFDSSFTYVKGQTVRPFHAFNPDVTSACKSGIHFFTTRREAVAW